MAEKKNTSQRKNTAEFSSQKETESDVDKIVGVAIGTKLRRLYAEVAKEPVPDRFTDLLKRLEGDQRSKDGE